MANFWAILKNVTFWAKNTAVTFWVNWAIFIGHTGRSFGVFFPFILIDLQDELQITLEPTKKSSSKYNPNKN